MVICDLEAGVGSLLRLTNGQVDVTLVIAEPSAKSIGAATRAAQIADPHGRVIVVANRVRDDSDVQLVRDALGHHEMVVIPYDPLIRRADQDGTAPIESGVDGPGLAALKSLAAKLQKLATGPD